MIESPQKADRKQKEKARNPHDSWLFWQGQKDSNIKPQYQLVILNTCIYHMWCFHNCIFIVFYLLVPPSTSLLREKIRETF